MTGTRRHDARPGANGLWRRVLSCVVALSILFAAVEPALAHVDQAFACASATLTVQQADGDQGHPSGDDQAPGQHCAHCGCHQPAQLDANVAKHAGVSFVVRFDLADSDRPGRSTAPPSKPPRA